MLPDGITRRQRVDDICVLFLSKKTYLYFCVNCCSSDSRLSARLSSGSSSTRPSPPPEHKDSDSDFAELSTLDDVDVSDQLIRRKQVRE